ncbi:MAG: pyruvate, phosphate dikinase, partial [Acidimicrobiia bacterium]|nr:pyruvate, phosphate dikinase [Acidimicrobiia bacterium]
QWVYAFSTGDGKDKQLLGGKGANLCEMTQIGLNVPPGFVITTQACLQYLDSGSKAVPEDMMRQVRAHMAQVEEETGKGFGDPDNPLLVSVRSGSAMSMPGMMDTILNLGLNAETLRGEIEQTGDARFGYDAYRRFIQLFGKVAMGVPDEVFDAEFEAVKQAAHVTEDVGLSADNLEEISQRFLNVFREHIGRPFPEDPYEQLEISIKAVFGSWMGKRAIDYRNQFKITPEMANGTAVNVCTMVFGNRGNDSATGVGFTRNPGTGEDTLYGEYLVNAQGEDVVAGIRTPKPIDELGVEMPEMARQLGDLRDKLELHYQEVQDFEFTIERGVLYCLQTRNGKMNTVAMVRTSVEMAESGLIDRDQALLRIDPMVLEQMLYPQLSPDFDGEPMAEGLPASPGAASGYAVFDADRAESQGIDLGRPVILVREETKPEDIHGFFASEGILTSRGGKTSHAAVVARGMGKPCVAGAEGIHVDVQRREATVGGQVIREGEMITIDGSSGRVYLGTVPMVEPEFTDELKTLLEWADASARLHVLANADTPDDAEKARSFGAQGIGLCRTERMFNSVERLPVVIEMIVADDDEQRQAALDQLLPMQRQDFRSLFETMAPHPVTIRLLDPPIHEFLPTERQLQHDIEQLNHLRNSARGMEVLASSLNLLEGTMAGEAETAVQQIVSPEMVDAAITKKSRMLRQVRALTEVNPMLGHRGVRLGITFPEIYRMQIRAILEAEAECAVAGLDVRPQMMVPQVCTAAELRWIRSYVDEIRAEVEERTGQTLTCRFGTMIEVVRACMR